MKKIICPVDFSTASKNAMEYAARLAGKMGATLTLFNIQKIYLTEGVSMFSGTERESVAEAKENARVMVDYVSNLTKSFSIPCSFQVIPSMSSFETAIADESNSYDLIIIGTNGADNIYQFYSGSHSYRVSKHTAIPVLIVPENCAYKEISHIVFTSGYKQDDSLLIKQLREFIKDFNPSLTVLHVSEKETPVSQEVFHSFTHLLDEAFDYSQKINFHRVINKDAAFAVEQFMHSSKADALAVCIEEHGYLYRMFHTNLIKKITSYADYPILVFHK